MSLFQQFGKNAYNNNEAMKLNGMPPSNQSTPNSRAASNTPVQATPSPAPPVIPGALAVAASPAAQLFDEDDWSWHRNPAASIRSGGTNKQTPVWKYFVYNKAENLSRCIVGNCTYMLKGPHTSTLACHLKKHTHEYQEFQKLKSEYSRDRNVVGGPNGLTPNSSGSSGGGGGGNNKTSSSASSSASSCASSFSVGGEFIKQGINHQLFGSSTPLSRNENTLGFSNFKNSTRNNGLVSPVSSSSPNHFDAAAAFNGIFGGLGCLPPLSAAMNVNVNQEAAGMGFFSPSNNNSGTIKKKPAQNGKGNSSMSNILNLLSARAAAAAAASTMVQSSSPSQPASEQQWPLKVVQERAQLQNVGGSSSAASTPKFHSNVFHSALDLAGSSSGCSSSGSVKDSSTTSLMRDETSLTSSPIHSNSMLSHNSSSASQTAKKKQDRRKRQLDTKLALAVATSKLPLAVIHNPLFKALMECAHPGFAVPTTNDQLQQMIYKKIQMIHSQVTQTLEAIKEHLRGVPKFSLLVDIIQLVGADYETMDKSDNNVRLCISAAFFSPSSQQVEVILLAVRQTNSILHEAIQEAVNKTLCNYDLETERISRIHIGEFPSKEPILGLHIEYPTFPHQIEDFNRHLTETLGSVFEVDPLVQAVKKTFHTMLQNFVNHPNAVAELNKVAGRSIDLRTSKSFLSLAKKLLEIKECFLIVCCQQPLGESPIEMITDTDWNLLHEIVQLLLLFQKHSNLLFPNGAVMTIDRVLPSLRELESCLASKSFTILGDLSVRLWVDLRERCRQMWDVDCDGFDGTFVQATALNPYLASTSLDERQLYHAKVAIEQVLSERMGKTMNYESCDINSVASPVVLNYFEDMLLKSAESNLPSESSQFEPLKFWQLNKGKCPELSMLAVELLSIPTSMISLSRVENEDDDRDENTNWRRPILESLNRLPENEELSTVERDALLCFNNKYIPEN